MGTQHSTYPVLMRPSVVRSRIQLGWRNQSCPSISQRYMKYSQCNKQNKKHLNAAVWCAMRPFACSVDFLGSPRDEPT